MHIVRDILEKYDYKPKEKETLKRPLKENDPCGPQSKRFKRSYRQDDDDGGIFAKLSSQCLCILYFILQDSDVASNTDEECEEMKKVNIV